MRNVSRIMIPIPINPCRIDQSIDCAAMTLKQYRDGHHKHVISPSRPFPFKGARNETGHYGYVHDPCILIRRPLPLQQVEEICHALPGNGTEGRAGQLIADHLIVFGDHPSPKCRPSNNAHPETAGVAKLRIFCSLYTYPGGNNLTDAIRETWGKDCDGFLAASSETLASHATVDISHFGRPNVYDSIWNRVQSAIVYIYENFLFDYDFFYFCGDDTFLIVENLRYFLESKAVQNATETNKPFHAGVWLHPIWRADKPHGFYYTGGGGGYVLNRAALELLVHNLSNETIDCQQSNEQSAEDFHVGLCLWNYGNISSFDTTDHLARNRFHLSDPNTLVTGGSDKWKRWWGKQVSQLRQMDQYSHLNQMQVYGVQSVSPESISFHKIGDPHYMRRLYLLFHPEIAHEYCPNWQQKS